MFFNTKCCYNRLLLRVFCTAVCVCVCVSSSTVIVSCVTWLYFDDKPLSVVGMTKLRDVTAAMCT